MPPINNYLNQLSDAATRYGHRVGVVLRGNKAWQTQVVTTFFTSHSFMNCFHVGGGRYHWENHANVHYCDYEHVRKGQQLLGRECNGLIYDLNQLATSFHSDGHEFDANSLNAALGALKGGGILFILDQDEEINGEQNSAYQWLKNAFKELTLIQENAPIPDIPCYLLNDSSLYQKEASFPSDHHLAQQQNAILQIIQVVEGHRKRPLVITADRGRGKSSALGIAAAELMMKRNIHIVTTAPSMKATATIFEHAQLRLPGSRFMANRLEYQQSSLSFIAPDELLNSSNVITCDLLLVDEASMIPLNMLKQMVMKFHRIVFSTTIHGYEGCGRGFTLKFQTWLKTYRPNSKAIHIDQPIRWQQDDPLEAWQFRTFLLNYNLASIENPFECSTLQLKTLSKQLLISQPMLLQSVFSLLVNAHYQTSPNDLFRLLSNDAIQLHLFKVQHQCIACVLTVREGNLEPDLVEAVMKGKRRPRGHLVPVSLANQMGIREAATASCLRIMRIAVHPEHQNKGIGSQLIKQLIDKNTMDYVATSFGATTELLQFWHKQAFIPVKIGSQRDQASGCYSIIMLRNERTNWSLLAHSRFKRHFIYSLLNSLQRIDAELVRSLLYFSLDHDHLVSFDTKINKEELPIELIRFYAQGGSDFESIAVWLHQLLTFLPQRCIPFISDLLIHKIMQQNSWQECAIMSQLTGRKETEYQLRCDIKKLLISCSL